MRDDIYLSVHLPFLKSKKGNVEIVRGPADYLAVGGMDETRARVEAAPSGILAIEGGRIHRHQILGRRRKKPVLADEQDDADNFKFLLGKLG